MKSGLLLRNKEQERPIQNPKPTETNRNERAPPFCFFLPNCVSLRSANYFDSSSAGYRVLLGFAVWNWIKKKFIVFFKVLQVLLGSSRFQFVSFVKFYRVLPSFTGFSRVLLGSSIVNWYHFILLSLIGFSSATRISYATTCCWVYRVLLGFDKVE